MLLEVIISCASISTQRTSEGKRPRVRFQMFLVLLFVQADVRALCTLPSGLLVVMDVLDECACIHSGEVAPVAGELSVDTVAHVVVSGEKEQRVLHPVVAELAGHQCIPVLDAVALENGELVGDEATQIARVCGEGPSVSCSEVFEQIIRAVCRTVFALGTSKTENLSREHRPLLSPTVAFVQDRSVIHQMPVDKVLHLFPLVLLCEKSTALDRILSYNLILHGRRSGDVCSFRREILLVSVTLGPEHEELDGSPGGVAL